MSASDLPDMGWSGPRMMARKLCAYLDNPYQIRQRLKEEDFQRNLPDIETIIAMRQEHLASLEREKENHHPSDAWKPVEASNSLAKINKRFVEALEEERAYSRECRG